MQFFNVLEKNAAAAAMIFSKTYRDRAAAAMTSFKTCRNRAAMDISGSYAQSWAKYSKYSYSYSYSYSRIE